MRIYCEKCEKITRVGSHCEHCKKELNSNINNKKSKINIIIDKSKPHWSHALGRVVKNNSEERREAKARGLVEVGNEKLHKHIKPKRKKYTW